jgi:TPR repeat protein
MRQSVRVRGLIVAAAVLMATANAKASDLYDFFAAYNAGDLAGAAAIIEPLAKKGNAEAQYQLAAMLERGKAFHEDAAGAVKWYQAAADQGHAQAQAHLAYAYEWGQGIEKNPYQAMKWYRKAAFQGNGFAAYQAANMNIQGKGAARDPAVAFMLARLAEENGWQEAADLRERIEAGLTPELHEHGEALFEKCIQSNYQICQ